MSLILLLLCSRLLDFSQGALTGSPVPLRLPFNQFLLQEPAFQVESGAGVDDGTIATATVPLVMKLLFEQAERVENEEGLPHNGDFMSLARSIQPISVEELGLQRVILDFPALKPDDIMPEGEAWLAFQLRQSHMLGNNCTQMLTVFENKEAKMQPVVTVPLNYQEDDPLVMVNITRSLRGWRKTKPSYVILIKDSTSYTRDRHLFSFSNYIDCSLARACEVLELHNLQSSPVLLLLSPELAAKKIMESQGTQGRGRFRRSLDSFEDRTEPESEEATDSMTEDTTPSEDVTTVHSVLRRTQREENYCHFHEWSVNVEQLGWNWLVYPERIPINLCWGKCPVLLDRQFNATSHAVARGLHRLNLGLGFKPDNPSPCCVPVKYRQFTMLIEKSPGVISLENSYDLSASKCGCR